MNSDFKEMLAALNAEGVEFLLVGGHAVMFHAQPRFTKDWDLWVNPTPENAARVWAALIRFKAPLSGVSESDFTNQEMVFQIGLPPNRMDFLMCVDGIEFSEAWPNRVPATYDGVPMPVISKPDLIRNKRASGRPQDLIDLEKLLELS